jgi:hypothetical protein
MTRRSGGQSARRESKPGSSFFTNEHVLHIPVRRVTLALLPEPVDVSRAIGRPPVDWEAELIIEARRCERARELALFKGIC